MQIIFKLQSLCAVSSCVRATTNTLRLDAHCIVLSFAFKYLTSFIASVASSRYGSSCHRQVILSVLLLLNSIIITYMYSGVMCYCYCTAAGIYDSKQTESEGIAEDEVCLLTA